jgi:hypothetical protein
VTAVRRAALGAMLISATACGGSVPPSESAPVAQALPQESAPGAVATPFGATRAPARSVAFTLRDVPVVDVSAPVGASSKLPIPDDLEVASTQGDHVRTLGIKRRERTIGVVTVKDHGTNTTATVSCDGAAPSDVEWETLTFMPDGRALYTVSTGVIDQSCRPFLVRRQSTGALPLVAGMLYAVRRCEGVCTDATPLSLLTPQIVAGQADELGRPLFVPHLPLGRVDLPIRRGAASSFEATIDGAGLRTLLGNQGAWSNPQKTLTVGVDLSQSASETSPVAVAYFTEETLPPQPPPPIEHVDLE